MSKRSAPDSHACKHVSMACGIADGLGRGRGGVYHTSRSLFALPVANMISLAVLLEMSMTRCLYTTGRMPLMCLTLLLPVSSGSLSFSSPACALIPAEDKGYMLLFMHHLGGHDDMSRHQCVLQASTGST